VETLLARADKAMRQAKLDGRDRVIIAKLHS
jgi:PleD family two-component response regulator